MYTAPIFMFCVHCMVFFVFTMTALKIKSTRATPNAAIITASVEQAGNIGVIKEINTNVTLHERGDTVQFLVSWKDNLPKGTSYNIIVAAVNATECPEPTCSVYGITKDNNQFLIPESTMPYVDQNECGYMFGCNYSLIVETSNAMVSKSSLVAVPYCVMDTCSCRHAEPLPKIVSSVNIINNETIMYNWLLKYKDGHKEKTKQHGLQMFKNQWKIHLIISESTNPSLSWGGKLIPISEYVFPLRNATQQVSGKIMQGSFQIKLPQQFDSKVVLSLRSYLTDDYQCGGPENFVKVTVPNFFNTEETLKDDNYHLAISLIIVSVLFFGTIFTVSICFWRRRKAAKLREGILQKDDTYMSPFATIVEMEDNINYVDKYVEEAQAKGLADVFEVPHSSVHIGAEIGEGAFGRVYKAIVVNLHRMRGNTIVAVKQLKKNPTADEVAEFLGEIEMLKGVGTHNNIVCFMGCCTIRPPYLMIMEYVGRGDLLTYLRTVRQENCKFKSKHNYLGDNTTQESKPPVKYIELKISTQSVDSEPDTERQAKPSFAETTYTIVNDDTYNEPFEYILDHKELHNFALQIANGMRFLEEQEITHRDLAARNVLIDDHKTLKISDFGLSRRGIYTNTKTRKLPLRWLSIEAIRDNVYSSKSDVWAYGVVLWEIGTLGASPYPTISNHELIPYLLSGKRLEKPEICTDQVYGIILQCWDENVDNRPSFAKLYKVLSPCTAYVDINSLSDDYVFPPIKNKKTNIG